MAHRQLQSGRHGFTLVELLVVIAIIGMIVGLLLLAVIVPARQAGGRSARTISSNWCWLATCSRIPAGRCRYCTRRPISWGGSPKSSPILNCKASAQHNKPLANVACGAEPGLFSHLLLPAKFRNRGGAFLCRGGKLFSRSAA